MVTKTDAKNTNVNWKKVYDATEIRRTYLITDENGRQFYKMYKPSEVDRIFKAEHWTGRIVSTVNRNKKEPKKFKDIIRDRDVQQMTKPSLPSKSRFLSDGNRKMYDGYESINNEKYVDRRTKRDDSY